MGDRRLAHARRRATALPELDARSFWEDEAVTVFLLREGFGDMLALIPQKESTPPVYYVLAWAWFSAVERAEAQKFTLVRYRAAAPVEVSLATLEDAALDEGTVGVLGGERRAGR